MREIRTGGDVSGIQWILGCYTTNKRMDIGFNGGKFGLHLGSKNNNSLAVAAPRSFSQHMNRKEQNT